MISFEWYHLLWVVPVLIVSAPFICWLFIMLSWAFGYIDMTGKPIPKKKDNAETIKEAQEICNETE